MPRPTPADIGLVLLAAVVVTAAGRVATQDPAPPARTVALEQTPTPTGTPSPRASTSPLPSPSPSATASALTSASPTAAQGSVLLVGRDLAPLAQPLTALGWEVLVGEPGEDRVLAEDALAGITQAPVLVVLEVEAGSRTSSRVDEAIAQVRVAFPEVVTVLSGPFDPEAALTTEAVQQAATDQGVVFVDPVARGWTEGADAEAVAAELATTLSQAAG